MNCTNPVPSFQDIIDGHVPDIYWILWTVAGTSILATLLIMVPHLVRMYQRGCELCLSMDRGVPPAAHLFREYMCFLPILLVCLNSVALLSPTSMFAADVLIEMSIAAAFCSYYAMVVGMCGGLGAMGRTVSLTATAKCFSRQMSHTTCAHMTYGIAQCVIFLPICSLAVLAYGYEAMNLAAKLWAALSILSTLIAAVNMMWLTRFATQIIKEGPLWGKFFAMKGVILSTKVTKTIALILSVSGDESRPEYTTEVLSHAVSVTISIAFMPFVAYACRTYFLVEEEQPLLAEPPTDGKNNYGTNRADK